MIPVLPRTSFLALLGALVAAQALEMGGSWHYFQRNINGWETSGSWTIAQTGDSISGTAFPSNDQGLKIVGVTTGSRLQFTTHYLDPSKQHISGFYRYLAKENDSILSGFSRSNEGDIGLIVAARDPSLFDFRADELAAWGFTGGPGRSTVPSSSDFGAHPATEGRLHRSVEWIRGAYGYGLRLGGDTAVAFGMTPDTGSLLSGFSAFTWEAWVRPLSAQAAGSILRYQAYEGRPLYALDLLPDGRVSFRMARPDSGLDTLRSALKLRTGRWSRLAVTGDRDSLKLYVDDRLEAALGTEGRTLPGRAGSLHFGIAGPGRTRLEADLDEVRLYRRALSPRQLLVTQDLVGNFRDLNPPNINLALPHAAIAPGQSASVPVLLAHYDSSAIHSVQFQVGYPRNQGLTLEGVEKSLGAAKGWTVNYSIGSGVFPDLETVKVKASCSQPGSACQALQPGQEVDIVRLRFRRAKGTSASATPQTLSFKVEAVNEETFYGFSTPTALLTSGGNPKPAGDLDLDGMVSTKDALSLLRYLVGSLPASDSGLAGLAEGLADANLDKMVNSFDAATMLRSAMGFTTSLPWEPNPFSQTSAEAHDVELFWETEPATAKGQVHKLKGRGMAFLLAAEFRLQLPAAASGMVQDLSTPLPGARIAGAPDLAAGFYRVAMAWPRELFSHEVELFRITLPPSGGKPELVSALLNGGAFTGNFPSDRLPPAALRAASPVSSVFKTLPGALALPLAEGKGARVRFLSATGRDLGVRSEVQGGFRLFRPGAATGGPVLYRTEIGRNRRAGFLLPRG